MTQPIALSAFDLDAPVGEGAMGVVWRGHHRRSGMAVAVKMLTWEYARQSEFRAAFRNEVRAIAALDHPNIVAVLDQGEVTPDEEAASGSRLAAGTPYLVMEFIQGDELSAWKGQLDWPLLLGLLERLLQALAHAHARGLVHRDIKPGNIIWDGRPAGLKLVDFGLSHVLDRDRRQHEDLLVGTPTYMAPEQFQGAWWSLGPWTDLYAVGCLAWALATGAAPFQGAGSFDAFARAHLASPLPRFEAAMDVPHSFERWLRRLLQKRPEARFQRAADALNSLRSLDEVDPEGFGPANIDFPRTWRIGSDEAADRGLLWGPALGLSGLRTLPLVGREVERSVLWDALGRVRETGRPEALLIEGPAGFGKTRLGRWLGERADELGVATILHATHSPGPSARSGLGGLVSRFLRLGGMPRDEVARALRERLQALGAAEADEWEDLTELVSPAAEDPAKPAGRYGPVLRLKAPQERFELVRRFVQRVAGGRVPIVLVDDAQWATETLVLVQHLLEPPVGQPMPALILMTVRDGDTLRADLTAEHLAILGERPEVGRISLGPLAAAESSVLLRQLLGLDLGLARRVQEATGGNPQFAVQLVEDWVDRRLLEPGDRGFVLRADEEALPTEVQQLWSWRLERALRGRPRAQRLAVELAAVLGLEVDGAEWKKLCLMAGTQPPMELVELLISQRLAWCEGGGPEAAWGFVHELLRDGLLSGAAAEGRLELQHRACARMLAQEPGPLAAERRGRHLLASGTAADLEDALDPLLHGADARMQRGEYKYAEWLLDLRDQAMERRGLGADDVRWGEGWVARIYSHRMRGHFDEARKWVDRCVPYVVLSGWERIGVHVDRERGLDALLRGDALAAWGYLRSAEQAAQELWDGQLLVDCRRSLGYALRVRGDLDESEAVFLQALRGCVEGGDVVGAANCRVGLGRSWVHASRYDDAELMFRSANEIYAAHNMRWEQASTLNDLGDTLRGQGRLEEAEGFYRQARGRLLALGAVHAVYPVANLGQMLAAQERWGDAREVLESALSIFDRQGLAPMQGTLHALLLAPVIAQGDLDAFDLHLAEARRLLDETGFIDPDVANGARMAGDRARDIDEKGRARGAYTLASRQLRRLGREDEARHVEVVVDLLEGMEPPVHDDAW